MNPSYRAKPRQLAGLLLILGISWLLWSGIYKPILIALGLFSCLLSLWLGQRMGFFRHPMPLRALLRLPGLWMWLLKEVIKSSLEVARIVLARKINLSTRVIEIDADRLEAVRQDGRQRRHEQVADRKQDA